MTPTISLASLATIWIGAPMAFGFSSFPRFAIFKSAMSFWLRFSLFALCLAAPGSPLRASEHKVEWNGTIFHTLTVRPAEVELYWESPEGQRFKQFRTLQSYLQGQNKRLRFIMNGGLFEEGGVPCGLLVIDGKSLRPLNMRDAPGNFYLKPNGVFYIDKTGAHIVDSEEYKANPPSAPRLAIQSGPLLLRQNRIHPAFRKESTNRLHRNGVGMKKDGSVIFVITEFDQPKRVTLHEFAEFFQMQGCENALFLDGDISKAYFDPKGEIPAENYYGTIFAVTEEKAPGKRD